jgi:saxitoxin biosynthesis operon SxtJ-like protein
MSDTAVPEAERAAAPAATAADLRRARAANLLGLVTPLANLGMLRLAPPDLRWFGVGAGCVLTGAAALAWCKGHFVLAVCAAAAHVALVLAGLVNPRLPEVPGRLWIGFGTLLGKVVAVPLFAALYFLVVSPTAVLVRLCAGDPLKRKAPPQESYWIDRDPVPPERFERQF